MKSKVIIKEQNDYDLIQTLKHIREIFNELNIFDKIKDLQTILIKPNLLGPHNPLKAVTTHPTVVEAVIIILKELNKEIFIGDSPGGSTKAPDIWKITGMREICDRHEVKLIDFGKEGRIEIDTDIAKLFFEKKIFECDGIINIAKLKTHSLMLYTGAVKNFYGAIPGLYKSELHRDFPNPKDFAFILSKIYELIKPKIIVNLIDGIIGMDGEGPSAGKPYPYNMLIASEKASAADYIVAKMMCFDVNNITYVLQSMVIDNITEADIEIDEKYINHRFQKLKIKNVIFINKILGKMPKFIKKIFREVFDFFPVFKKDCVLCMICVKSCPVTAIYKKNKKLYITPKKCIKCFCCHEMCPLGMIELKRTIVAKLLFFRRRK